MRGKRKNQTTRRSCSKQDAAALLWREAGLKQARKVVLGTVCFVLFVLSGFLAVALAAPGDLDPTFGSNGKVTTDLNGTNAYVFATALQPDGRIIVAGRTLTNYNDPAFFSDFALARYNPDGSLDSTFGSDGKVTTHLNGGQFDTVMDLALQPDGRIVAVGQARNDSGSGVDITVVRYNPDGSLDPTFGNGGKVQTHLAGTDDRGSGVVLQPDGKIVVAGRTGNAYLASIALVRYDPDGSLDPTFGTGGVVVTHFDGGYHTTANARDLALQPDGKLVAVGFYLQDYGFSTVHALVRYNPDGSLDSTFGNGGKVISSVTGYADAMALKPDGKIIVAGSVTVGYHNDDFELARYNSDGSLDTSFGSNGKVTTTFSSRSDDMAHAVALQPDGKIVAAGETGNYPHFHFALVRYGDDGQLDPTFGSNGKVSTILSSSWDAAYALALQPNGKIVAAGECDQCSKDLDIALVRYLAAPRPPPPPPAPPPGATKVGGDDPAPPPGDGNVGPEEEPPPGDGDVGPGEELSELESDTLSGSEEFSPPRGAPSQSQGVVWQLAGSGSAVSFSPDGQTLLEGNRLRRASDGTLIRTFNIRTSGGQIDAVAFSPDSQYVAMGVASFNLNLSLFRVSDGTRLAELTGSSNGTTTVKFSPDGQFLACGGRGGTVKLLHVPDMTLVKTFLGGVGYGARVFALLFSNDGQFLAVGGQGGAQIIRISDGVVVHTLVDGTKTITSLAFSPDGQTLATGFFTADQNNLYPVKFWRFSDGALLKTIEASDQGILALAYQPDGQVIASGGGDDTYAGVVRFFRLSDSSQLGFFPQDPNNLFTYVTGVAYSPDSKLVAYARHDSFIVVTRNPFASRQPPPPPAPPITGGHGDTDPIPPPGDGDVGPGEEPPSAQ